MRLSPAILTALLMILSGQRSFGQIASVGFYNVENLYDTIPSLFYDDGDYTPQGRLKWDTRRYETKLRNLSKVLDGMGLDIVGLAEVENERVVRDLVSTLATDYNYIHLTGGDRRGMDLALLYKGDKFVCGEARLVGNGASREFLHVQGKLLGERIDVVVCHMPSRINSRRYRERAFASLRGFADSLLRADPVSRLILMGDFNAGPSDPSMRRWLTGGRENSPNGNFFSPLTVAASEGKGSYAYNDRWMLLDNIFLSAGFRGNGAVSYSGCGIFIKEYMLARDGVRRRGFPLRTFTYGEYTAGYSDHLPVYVIFEFGAR